MKVEKVGYKTYNNASQKLGQAKLYNLSNTAFTGQVPNKDLVKELRNIIPSPMKVISRLAKGMGEIQNIVINALGTGLVAPLFIKYNPLSKTDEDTRTYTAWRQPVSAVLAVATQAGMVAPFNSIINDMAYSGYYPEEYNLSNFKTEKYIQKLIKESEPNLNEEELAHKIQVELAKQHKELKDNIRYKNRIIITSPDKSSTNLSQKAYDNTLMDTLNDLIKKDTQKKVSCDTKQSKRLIRSKILSTNSKEIQPVLSEIKTELDKAKSLDEMKTYLKKEIDKLKNKKANHELIDMVQEILDRNKSIGSFKIDEKSHLSRDEIIMEALREKATKMLNHANKYVNISDEKAVTAEVEKSVAARKTAFAKSLDCLNEIKKNIESGKKYTVIQIEKILKEKAKGVEFEDSALHIDFAEEMISKYKKNIENNLKGHKQFTGLVISLAVLPITCCLLNWVYPRFMDAVFPNLSNKKHDNESKRLVDKAPKQAGGAT